MSKLTDLLKDIAPTLAGALGTAVGGPVAGLALSTISSKLLGHPNGSEADVTAAAMTASPDKLLELRKEDHDFEFKMKELGFKTEELRVEEKKAELADTQDARAMYRQTQNQLTNYMAVGIILASFALATAVITGNAPGLEDPKVAATAGTIVGLIFRELKHVLAFFFGQLSKDD